MQFGDVVLVDLPRPVGTPGSEQFGQRPAVIFHPGGARANLSTLVVVPLTSQPAGLRFQGSFSVHPSQENGLTEESIVLVHQIRAIDKRRIRKVIGHLEKAHVERLKDELRAILNL